MARGINEVTLIGNLGADPDTRYTAGGSAITKLRLATTEQWRDKQSGEQQERVEWHRITIFGKLAEIAGEYCTKGKQVYIRGSLRTNKYTDKDGVERYSTEVIADELLLLGGGTRNDDGDAPQGAARTHRQQTADPRPAAQRSDRQLPRQAPPNDGGASTADTFEDDGIPF